MLPTCGLIDQRTPAFEPVTVAVNCCAWLSARVAVAGDSVTEIGCSVMVALPLVLGSKTLVAVTVTFWLAAIWSGAAYRPLLVMAPTCGLILQVTPVWLMPVTVAENCCDCPLPSVTADGLTS